jgi:hypothetical protein
MNFGNVGKNVLGYCQNNLTHSTEKVCPLITQISIRGQKDALTLKIIEFSSDFYSSK